MKDLQSNYSFLGRLSPSVTLSLAARAKELKKQGLDVCSMSVGEPDFDTPQAIKDAGIKAINEGKVRYIASSGLPELKDELISIQKIVLKDELGFDTAIISKNDKIVPYKNQLNFWQNKALIKEINATHCPFEEYSAWSELL